MLGGTWQVLLMAWAELRWPRESLTLATFWESGRLMTVLGDARYSFSKNFAVYGMGEA